MSVDQMSVNQMSVNQMSVDHMSVDQTPVDQTVFCRKTRSQSLTCSYLLPWMCNLTGATTSSWKGPGNRSRRRQTGRPPAFRNNGNAGGRWAGHAAGARRRSRSLGRSPLVCPRVWKEKQKKLWFLVKAKLSIMILGINNTQNNRHSA